MFALQGNSGHTRRPIGGRPVGYRATVALIRVAEPFAAPPRLPKPRRCPPADPADFEIDRGLLEISGVALDPPLVDGGSLDDLDEIAELLIEDSAVTGIDLTSLHRATLDVVRSSVERCDLSRLTFRSIRASRVIESKFVGSELSGALLTDVVFERCTFRYANLRMAQLRRVRFDACQLVELDAFDASMEDVDFEDSTLTEVNIDRLHATRVDLRHASTIDLVGLGDLRGLLVAEEQLPALAFRLATALGLGVEAPPDE